MRPFVCLGLLLLASPYRGSDCQTRAARGDTIAMVVRFEVAEGMHATADSLGQISGIARDRRGVVYASDMAASKIWVFGPDGQSLPSIGRRGRGPGEFESPTGLAIAPGNFLVVRDVYNVSLFGLDRQTNRLTRFDRSFRGPPLVDWKSTRASRFLDDGRLVYPAHSYIDRSQRSARYNIYSESGALVDSLIVPPFASSPSGVAFARLGAQDGRILPGLNHVPFAPLPVWDVTPRGTLLLGDGVSYDVREQDRSGTVLRSFRRSAAAAKIPVRERAESTAALRARLDSVSVPWSQVEGVPPDVRAARLPETFPFYVAVYYDDGLVWIQRWIAGGANRTVFDVFRADGTFFTVVMLPRALASFPTPVLTLQHVTGVGINPETGAHSVLHFVRAAP